MRTTAVTLAGLLLSQSSSLALAAKKDDTKKSGVTKAQGPPPFFLQDPSDSLCLGGDEFKRCSIDTLFFVVGTPGKYQIHKRPIDETSGDDSTCITKPSCAEKDSKKIQDIKLAKCTHCGAKNWNILGDSQTGYVLTEGEGDSKVCVVREKGTKKVKVAPCESDEVTYTPLQLQFASAADVTAMSSNGARFIGAASDGDKKLVQSFLKGREVDVNEKDWDNLTALITAASAGHMDIVKILLKASADVNASDKDGITALMEASIMGHDKIVNALIDAGAEVDFKSNSGVTALWLAAGENKVSVMKTLLKKHADASVTRSDGITALMTSSVAGHVEAAKLLLEDGANPLATDADGLTALMNAAEKGATDVIKVLVDATKNSGDDTYVDMMSSTGFNALIISAAHGHTESVKYLITEAGADVNLVHDNKVSALMYAAASGHVDTMKVLLKDGKVDINDLHTNGGSALIEACTAGASDAISFLIENGANYNIVDLDGVTPLMAIAAQGNTTGVNSVISALQNNLNADQLTEHINMFSFSGGSAVMFSAAGGHSDTTKILIDLGADVNAVAQATPAYLDKLAVMIEEGTVEDNDPHVDGVTAAHVAAQGGHLDTIEILIGAGADVTILDDEDRTPLLLAVKGNYGDVAIALVKGGADPNTPYVDDEGTDHNLLFDSLVVENNEFAELLIEKGADIYSEDEHKVTALLQASHRGMADAVKALLAKNTNDEWINAVSDEGITPLIAASSEGHLEIVKMLIDAKADVNAQDKDKTNSLMAAAAKGHTDIVEALLSAGSNVNEQNVDGHTALMFAYNGKNQVETLWERYQQFVQESEVASEDEKVDDGGTGPIIRESLDNHNRMVNLLVSNGADESVKDKEGHTAKDFDFHPDADADVLKQEEQAGKRRDTSKNEL